VIGDSRVNTVRIARTWEHWWHGNECFRAQGSAGGLEGFKFGEETSGSQALCAPQLNHPQLLAQASTEAQGPWDSNFQIEDDFSWFIPGKKGDHELKFGARYNYTELERVSQINENGQFTFPTNAAFNAADPRTYPERLTIRMGTFNEFIKNHSWEFFAQDKWKINHRTTLSIGVRYDLEIIPIDETGNPLFANGQSYPVDKNNFAPRIGFTRAFDDQGRSVLRAGYGMFYNRTILGAIDDALEFSKFTFSNVVNFPNASADPGPSAGRFPTDPMLVNGPVINRALLNQMFPPGQSVRNQGVVIFDSPDRQQPYAHQATVGYGRELTATIAINADYIHSSNRDMFLARNLNPMVRVNTSRTGALTRIDAFGVLGEPYTERVWVMENTGYNDYDALNLSLEKRYANNWSGRISYSLSKSHGTAENQADKNTFQTLTDLNLDEFEGPSSVDRRHILAINGRAEIPKTAGATVAATFRYMSGSPFSIFNSNVDANRNGELNDPSPAGVYSGTAPGAAVLTNVENKGGRNGAIGPDYLQLDLRAGWRGRIKADHTVEVFFDIFNVTNRANFENPAGDERLPSTFLVLTNLRGGGGFPRQAQFGVRYAF
jgi:hypothetical protein